MLWLPGVVLVTAGLLGLCVGSFLNVVVVRLPRMMEMQWQRQCHDYLQQSPDVDRVAASDEPFNLAFPASHCCHCQHPLHWTDNIPLFSYLGLRGRCRYCDQPISMRYPLLEALTALLFVAAAWVFPAGWALLGAWLLLAALLAMSFIDLDKQLLPDQLTLPWLWLGLLWNSQGVYTSLASAVYGAVVGYLSLWLLYQAFLRLTGKEGLGYGDFKLLAMLGAWLGISGLLDVLLVASLTGSVLMLLARAMGRVAVDQPVPFGPFLALGGVSVLLFGNWITG